MHDNEEPRKVGALKQFLPEPSVDLVEQVMLTPEEIIDSLDLDSEAEYIAKGVIVNTMDVSPLLHRQISKAIPLIQKEVKEKILKDARFNLSRLRAPEQYETETGARCNAWFLTPKQWRDFWQSLKGGN